MDTKWMNGKLVVPAALVMSLGLIGCEKKGETPTTPTANTSNTAEAQKAADDAAAKTKQAADDAAAKTEEAIDAADDGG